MSQTKLIRNQGDTFSQSEKETGWCFEPKRDYHVEVNERLSIRFRYSDMFQRPLSRDYKRIAPQAKEWRSNWGRQISENRLVGVCFLLR